MHFEISYFLFNEIYDATFFYFFLFSLYGLFLVQLCCYWRDIWILIHRNLTRFPLEMNSISFLFNSAILWWQEVLLWIKSVVEECGENITKEQLNDYVWKTLNSGKVLSFICVYLKSSVSQVIIDETLWLPSEIYWWICLLLCSCFIIVCFHNANLPSGLVNLRYYGVLVVDSFQNFLVCTFFLDINFMMCFWYWFFTLGSGF